MAMKVPRQGMDEFLTLPEVAKLKGVTRIAVYKAVERGVLPAFRRGNRWFVWKRDINKYTPRRSNNEAVAAIG